MNLRPCIVHVGMYKTGTTSIQRTLAAGQSDRRFRFVTGDAAWGNLSIGSAFLGQAADLPLFRNRGYTGRRLERLRRSATRALARGLSRARSAGATPILSAEIAWRMNVDDARRLSDFLRDVGFEARIVACLRSPLDFLTSNFQEILKTGCGDWATIARRMRPLMNYRDTLMTFDQVFGREQVDAYVFEPATFPDGCAVREFCRRVGVDLQPQRVIRVNESMHASATRFLYAYNRHPVIRNESPWGLLMRASLLHRLRAMPGRSFRVTEDLLPGLHERFHEEQPWLETRLGRTFPWALRDAASGDDSRNPLLIREERNLLEHDSEALEWLAGRSKRPNLPVAEQLHHINRWPHPAMAFHFTRMRLRTAWYRIA